MGASSVNEQYTKLAVHDHLLVVPILDNQLSSTKPNPPNQADLILKIVLCFSVWNADKSECFHYCFYRPRGAVAYISTQMANVPAKKANLMFDTDPTVLLPYGVHVDDFVRTPLGRMAAVRGLKYAFKEEKLGVLWVHCNGSYKAPVEKDGFCRNNISNGI